MGTSALRRRAQLLAARADLAVVELRGNVDTRLRRLAAGEVDALVLARAGLARLGLLADGGDAVRLPGEAGRGGRLRPGSAALRRRRGAGHAAAAGARRRRERRRGRAARSWTPRRGRPCRPSARPCGRSARAATRRSACRPVEGRLRGFAGLPDGSAWVLDELEAEPTEAAGEALAARMLAAGAVELLARAEAEAEATTA